MRWTRQPGARSGQLFCLTASTPPNGATLRIDQICSVDQPGNVHWVLDLRRLSSTAIGISIRARSSAELTE